MQTMEKTFSQKRKDAAISDIPILDRRGLKVVESGLTAFGPLGFISNGFVSYETPDVAWLGYEEGSGEGLLFIGPADVRMDKNPHKNLT